MSIIKTNLGKQRNEEHYKLLSGSLLTMLNHNIINPEEDSVEGKMLLVFQKALDEEDKALEKICRSIITPALAKLNRKRNAALAGLRLCVDYACHSANEEEVEAAERIQIVMKHYGKAYRKPYNQKSGMISNLVQELNENYPAETTKIKANERIGILKTVNMEFELLMDEREQEMAKNAGKDMPKIRKATDDAFNKLIDYFNVMLTVDRSDKAITFESEMNEKINYYKHTVSRREGHSNAKKKSKED